MYINERFTPGELIEIAEKEVDTGGRPRTIKRRYQVLEQYPHHLVVQNEYGTRHSITNAELMQVGIATQWLPGQEI